MKVDSAVFYTKDIDAIKDFYQNVMGFKLLTKQGNRFCSFGLDGEAKLSIRIEEGEREGAGHQTVFIACPDIKNKYEELASRGANIPEGISEYDWGTKFDVFDPDNNKVEFIRWK